jgi:glycosyltransferase involved in cell wall biosynthesis
VSASGAVLRVLHVDSGNLYGGIETLLATLARTRELCPSMHAEYTLCVPGRLREELVAARAPVHVLGNVRLSRPTTVLHARRGLRRLLRHHAFDVVVCHSSWLQVIFGPVVRAAHLPLVLWRHAAGDGRHWLDRWARRTPPDLMICNSGYTQRALSAAFPETRSDVVYCPVACPPAYDDDDRASVRKELQTADHAVVILQASRMEPWKGHALHLQALRRLRDIPDWVCWQVGGAQSPHEAPYVGRLTDEARRLGIADRVRFVGQRSDVAKLMAAADIYCQPNLGPEPFGITLVEALYARLPVVTTALGAAPEIVDGSCGILVAPDDPDALAGALTPLIADGALRRHLGSAGPARARVLCDVPRQLRALERALTSATHEVCR